MMATAIIIAVIITQSSLAMPTAVMTESSENTMSMTMICPMTNANAARVAALARSSCVTSSLS